MKFYIYLTAVCAALFLAGCGEKSAEDPRLILAEKCRDEGDFQAAERQLRRYLNAFPEEAAIHLKLASLYDESLKDPVGAAYHYREYLRLAPDSDQRENVQMWLEEARRKCASISEKMVNEAQNAATELEKMVQENASLRQLALRQQQELTHLRRKIQTAAAVPAAVPAKVQQPAAVTVKKAAASAGYSIYEIKRGDTLGRIARHYYGSSQKIQPILEANALTPRSVLQIGQKLKIPKQAEAK